MDHIHTTTGPFPQAPTQNCKQLFMYMDNWDKGIFGTGEYSISFGAAPPDLYFLMYLGESICRGI